MTIIRIKAYLPPGTKIINERRQDLILHDPLDISLLPGSVVLDQKSNRYHLAHDFFPNDITMDEWCRFYNVSEEEYFRLFKNSRYFKLNAELDPDDPENYQILNGTFIILKKGTRLQSGRVKMTLEQDAEFCLYHEAAENIELFEICHRKSVTQKEISDDIDEVRRLLDSNIPVNVENGKALLLSVKAGKYQLTKLLLESYALVSNNNYAALRAAIEQKDYLLVHLLAKYIYDRSRLPQDVMNLLNNNFIFLL